MGRLVKKAIEKWRTDGVFSLISDGFTWIINKFKKRGKRRWKFRYKPLLARKLLLARKYDRVDCPYEYTYINPNDVKYYQLNTNQDLSTYSYSGDVPLHECEKGRFNPVAFTGMVIGGDWDLYKKDYEFDRVYSGLNDYYSEELPLEDTEYMEMYRIREEVRGDDGYLSKKIHERKELFENIKENGFKNQYELNEKKNNAPIYVRPWDITVNIGRDGELIFNNTAHNRLAISRLQNIEEIPVLIVVRHKKWQQLRESVKSGEVSKLMERGIDKSHPDLRNLMNTSK